MARWEFDTDSQRVSYCKSCGGSGEKCLSCEYGKHPELMPGNLEAWSLWLAVQTQWRVSFGGLVGLDYPAMFQMAEFMGIEMSAGTLAKIKALEMATLNRPDKAGVK